MNLECVPTPTLHFWLLAVLLLVLFITVHWTSAFAASVVYRFARCFAFSHYIVSLVSHVLFALGLELVHPNQNQIHAMQSCLSATMPLGHAAQSSHSSNSITGCGHHQTAIIAGTSRVTVHSLHSIIKQNMRTICWHTQSVYNKRNMGQGQSHLSMVVSIYSQRACLLY